MEDPVERVVDGLGRAKGVPVASFWPASGFLSPSFGGEGKGGEEHICSVKQARKRILNVIIEAMSNVKQAKCNLFRSIKDLEQSAIKAIKTSLSIPIYPIGPSITYFNNSKPTPSINAAQTQPNYIKWINCQPNKSVLYISLGSFLLTTDNEIEELATGLKQSAVRFLWVARDHHSLVTKEW
ncbi:hypothetical protein V2J09_016899 [Rumex salicifolius]